MEKSVFHGSQSRASIKYRDPDLGKYGSLNRNMELLNYENRENCTKAWNYGNMKIPSIKEITKQRK